LYTCSHLCAATVDIFKLHVSYIQTPLATTKLVEYIYDHRPWVGNLSFRPRSITHSVDSIVGDTKVMLEVRSVRPLGRTSVLVLSGLLGQYASHSKTSTAKID
jgi:hypothetical protein